MNEKWNVLRPNLRAVVDLGAAPGGWSQVVSRTLGWDGVPRGVEGEEEVQDPLAMWEAIKDSTTEERHVSTSGVIVAVDKLTMRPIPGVSTLQADFLQPSTASRIKEMLSTRFNRDGKADLILSDVGANQSGNRIRDVEQSLDICHAVLQFARRHLRNDDIELGGKEAKDRGGVLLYAFQFPGVPKTEAPTTTYVHIRLKHFAHPDVDEFRKEDLKPNFREVHYLKPSSSRSESSEGYFLCRGWRGDNKKFGLV